MDAVQQPSTRSEAIRGDSGRPGGSGRLGTLLSRIFHGFPGGAQSAFQLGSYRLIERLGAGGMGEVWRAEHRLLGRPAAVKLIRP
jgi:serine/threonine protein kinase